MLLDEVGRDETNMTSPALGRTVEGMDELEAIGVLFRVAFELVPNKNILFRLVGKDQRDLGVAVHCVLVAKNLPNHLKLTIRA